MLKNTAILSLCFLFFSYGVLAEDPGQKIFNEKCTACHTIGKGKTVGPDLKGVTTRRDPQWLTRWIMEPDKALAEKDETALALLKEFNNVPMPNFGITEAQAKDIIAYLGSGDAGAETKVEISWSKSFSFTDIGTAQLTALVLFLILSTVIVVVFMMIARSTRQSQPTIDMKAAYKIRAKFFVIATVIVVGTLWATLSRTPYPKTKENPNEPVKVIYVTAEQFNFSYSEAPILTMEDKKTVPLISALTIPPGTLVEFQVTSIDVTHDFAIYDSGQRIVAQTQAMPHYTNRLRVKFDKPGDYSVLCLEYCGLGHHKMRSAFKVAALPAPTESAK